MKKGFVFIESLVVLIALLATITTIYTLFTKISVNVDKREYYDNVSDLYKTDILRNRLTFSNLNSTEDLLNPLTLISSGDCGKYFLGDDCAGLYETLEVNAAYIVKGTSISITASTLAMNNSMREYLNYMNFSDEDQLLLLVSYSRNNKEYYANLEITKVNNNE